MATSLPAPKNIWPRLRPGLTRLGRGLLALLLVSILVGSLYQYVSVKNDEAAYPPLGQLYTVDGLRLHLYCLGQGSPTVLLEAGASFFSVHYVALLKQIAAFTRVCTYDRPGFGWSDPISTPQTAQQTAERFHALLAAAGEKPPYIVSGHSLGGIYTKAFANLYRAEVVGMVLMDSSGEDQDLRLPQPPVGYDVIKALLWACHLTTPVGLPRAIGLDKLFLANVVELYSHTTPFSAAEAQMLIARSNTYHYCATGINMFSEIKMLASQATPPHYDFGGLPIAVLVAGKTPSPEETAAVGYTPEMLALQHTIWIEIQTEHAHMSTRGELIIDEQSGHLIYVDQPELVVDSFRRMIESVR